MITLTIDIGGTKIAAAVCDENDSIIQHWHVPMPVDADTINQHVVEMYRRATAAGHTGIEAIGVSAAGSVSVDCKTLTFSANIPTQINCNLSEYIGALIDHAVPVVVENDVNCAGWNEYMHSTGQDSSNMVILTVDTGLGDVIVINGQLYCGSFGMTTELSHLPMVPNGDYYGCSLCGCAERYASGTSLEGFAKSAMRRRPQDIRRFMKLCGGDTSKLEGPMVSRATQEDDVFGLYVFDKIGERLGRMMATVSAVFNPDLFVIGGDVMVASDTLLKPVRYNYQRFLEGNAYCGHAKIVAATVGQNAGLIGTTNLALC